jgi:prolyl-tRNA synthetase
MRLSGYFLPILREAHRDVEIVSHRLMLRASMMRQEAAGIYAFLALGLRVLDICRIVRGGLDRSGTPSLAASKPGARTLACSRWPEMARIG